VRAAGSTSHARCAPGSAARSADTAGSVRTTSPIAPSRITSTRSARIGGKFEDAEMTASLAMREAYL